MSECWPDSSILVSSGLGELRIGQQSRQGTVTPTSALRDPLSKRSSSQAVYRPGWNKWPTLPCKSTLTPRIANLDAASRLEPTHLLRATG